MTQFHLLTFIVFEMMMVNKIITAYTKITLSTNGNSTNEGPKIYKALNTDLLVPQSLHTMQPKIANVDIIEKPLNEGPEKQEQQLAIMEKQPIYDNEREQQSAQIYVTTQNEQTQAITLNNNDNNEIIIKNNTNVQDQQNQAEQQQTIKDLMLAGSGRATAYRDSGYPFGQLITPLIKTARQKLKQQQQQQHQQQQQQQKQHILLPTSTSSLSSTLTSLPTVIYPLVAKDNIYQTQQEYPDSQQQQQQQQQHQTIQNYIKTYKLSNNNGGGITDRFTPGEAVASQQLKKHQPSHSHKRPQNSEFNVVQSDAYSFPPINIEYSKDIANNSTKFINSYVPPPSGVLMNGNDNDNASPDYSYKDFISDIHQIPQPYESHTKDPSDNNNHHGDGNNVHLNDHEEDSMDSIGVLPSSAMLIKPENVYNYHPIDDQGHINDLYGNIREYPTPPPGWFENHPKSSSEHPSSSDDHYYYEPTTNQHFKHIETFSQPIHIYNHSDHHEDINGDYDYQHNYPHHHHHQFVEYTKIPPQESRVKKYSYFYIGRKLWYIPLYFTVWFTFYVLWLILKSIARHKVNIPNHYVNRRSLSDRIVEPNQNDFINQLTINVWQKIEAFKEKYIK